MPRQYFSRIADEILDFKLKTKGAVWIRGAKWCGKSTTAERFAKSCIFMQDEGQKEQNMSLAKLDPSYFLQKDPPLLIDEWQEIPFIWNQIRFEIDRRDEFGQFILTGSVVPNEKDMVNQHSGIGRITKMTMRPMSLFESLESSDAVSIERLFAGTQSGSARCDKSVLDYAFFTVRGGWPKAIGLGERVALEPVKGYYNSIISTQLRTADRVRRNPDNVNLLLRAYARNCGTQANNSVLKRDMESYGEGKLDEDTIHSYVCALKDLFLIEESEAWIPNLRSKTAIRTSNTRYFVDPSIACAALGIDQKGLLADLKTFGSLFENLCVRDLRIYADRIGGKVKHFRTADGLECDVVIILEDGSWGAVEIKLGDSKHIEEAADNLKKLNDNIVPEMKKPLFLMVLTTVNVAYRREDGIWVVPLGCLGP